MKSPCGTGSLQQVCGQIVQLCYFALHLRGHKQTLPLELSCEVTEQLVGRATQTGNCEKTPASVSRATRQSVGAVTAIGPGHHRWYAAQGASGFRTSGNIVIATSTHLPVSNVVHSELNKGGPARATPSVLMLSEEKTMQNLGLRLAPRVC